MINNIIGNNTEIKFTDLPIDDPEIRKPDIKLAEKIIEWKPQINIHKLIDEMITEELNILSNDQ